MKTVQSMVMLVLGALLAGCAVNPVLPGMSQAQVLASYGAPTRIVPVAAGTRLQYSLQPAGQEVVMVDLDAAGSVTSVRQVMEPAEFARVQIGTWTRQDVEREFGPPAKVDRVYSWPSDIMNYRWRAPFHDMFWFVYLDANNVVQRTGVGMEMDHRIKDLD